MPETDYSGLLPALRFNLRETVELPDGRNYWLALARLYRPDVCRNIPRAEEVL